MKLNTQDHQELTGIVARMKADRVSPQMIQQAIARYVEQKGNQYAAAAEAQKLERTKQANIEKEKQDKIKKENEEKEKLAKKEKERVAALGYKDEFHPDNVKTWINKEKIS